MIAFLLGSLSWATTAGGGIAVWSPVAEAVPLQAIYVHVDVDVADPEELPAVNYPAPGGPSVDAVRAAVRHLAVTGRVVAASVSSWNPELPGAAQAAEATHSIMDVFLD